MEGCCPGGSLGVSPREGHSGNPWGFRTARTQVWADRLAACSGATEQRSQPVALPFCRTTPAASRAGLLGWPFSRIWVLNQWALLAPGREVNSKLHATAEHRLESRPSRSCSENLGRPGDHPPALLGQAARAAALPQLLRIDFGPALRNSLKSNRGQTQRTAYATRELGNPAYRPDPLWRPAHRPAGLLNTAFLLIQAGSPARELAQSWSLGYMAHPQRAPG